PVAHVLRALDRDDVVLPRPARRLPRAAAPHGRGARDSRGAAAAHDDLLARARAARAPLRSRRSGRRGARLAGRGGLCARRGEGHDMSLWFDLKYAWRLLLRSPGHALVCIVVVALSVGLALWTYVLAYSQALKPLPFSGGERWLSVQVAPKPALTPRP